MKAAPSTSESVTGAAPVTCGITFTPRLTNDVRSREMNSFFIMIAYWTGRGRSSPKSCFTAASVSGVGVAAGDPGGGVDAGRGEEDQVDQHADREHHEDHREEPADEERGHGAFPARSRARGSSASRRPSPKTFSVSTVSTIATPGAMATAGRV